MSLFACAYLFVFILAIKRNYIESLLGEKAVIKLSMMIRNKNTMGCGERTRLLNKRLRVRLNPNPLTIHHYPKARGLLVTFDKTLSQMTTDISIGYLLACEPCTSINPTC